MDRRKISLTQPIRIPFDSGSKSYRSGIVLAYPALFLLLAGDAVRYSIGWWGFGVAAVVMVVAAIFFIASNQNRTNLRRFPIPLAIFISYLTASVIWSNYQPETLLAIGAQISTTVAGLFFAIQFDWRQLLNIFANTLRFILLSSLLIELVATVTGPIRPIFGNYSGAEPPSEEYLWVQGNLFQSERIQGIVGNANLIAFIAVLGLAVFFVEYLVTARKRRLAFLSFVLAAGFFALAKSASMTIALFIVVAAAIVASLAEGKTRSARHRVYGYALWGLGFLVFLAIVYWSELTDILGKSPDASGRFMIWEKVWTLILEKPALGWGWISHWIPGVDPYEGLAVIDGVPYYHAHNAFLDVWLQLGLIGLMFFVWLLWTTFVRVWKVAVVHTNPLYFWPLFAFMVIATQALSESRLLVENGWMLLVLLALKTSEPFENLEPVGLTPKLKKLVNSFSGPFGR